MGASATGCAEECRVRGLHVRIKKKIVPGRPLPAILDYLATSYTDLVVLATRGEDPPGSSHPCQSPSLTASRPRSSFSISATRCPSFSSPSTRARWSRSVAQGDVIERILGTAADLPADLIVMASDGRNGILDALRGSHSEQILRRVTCRLLVVPITAHEMPLLLA